MQTKHLLLGLVCYSMTFLTYADTATEETDEDCLLKNPASFRLSLAHREANGIGYDQGYTSVDTFFAFTSIRNWHPFFDVRGHFFNNGKVAANAGFGIRYEPKAFPVLLGVNGFFDFRRANHSTFEQVGIGVEALGTKWFGRANGYFPIINRTHLYDTSFIGFKSHQALFSVNREFAFSGVDASLGRTLLQKQYYTLSSTLAGYMFFASYDQSAKGGLLKLKADISRYFSLEAQGSYDSLFKGIAQGQAAINVPFGKKAKTTRKGLSCKNAFLLSERVTEAVDRFEIIVTDELHEKTTAKNPTTGQDLYIVFVDNSNSGGNGTAESPYSTLLAAQNNSSSNQMIYVYEGTGSTAGMNSGIVLQDRQWLQGSGRPFYTSTSFGIAQVPAQTSNWPTIRNPLGNAITLANGNIVAGFNLTASGSAISGSNITDFLGSHNNCASSSTYDFSFVNPSGTITLTNNTSHSEEGLSLSTIHNLILTLQDNIFLNSGTKNMNLLFSDSSNSKLTLEFNTFQNSDTGSTIAATDNAILTLVIEDNEFVNIQNSLNSSLEVSASLNSRLIATFKNNLSQSPTLKGFYFHTTDTAISFLNILDNTGIYTGSEATAYPFDFSVDATATSTLFLEGNTAGSTGYRLSNDLLSTFYLESSTLDLQGVEDQNTGTFTLDGLGSITFIDLSDF